MPSITVAAGQASKPIRLQYGGKVTLSASSGGAGTAEYTTGSSADVENNVAEWLEWPAGSVTAGGSVSDYPYGATHLRVSCTAGTMTCDVENGSQSGAQFSDAWQSLIPFTWRNESLGPVERPAGFSFDWSYFPYAINRAADGEITIPGFNEESLIPYDCIGTTNVYYVDINAANDTGAGTSWATAKKGIDAMLAAASYPCIINVRGAYGGALYDQANSWNTSTPGGSCWVRAVGGRAISAICWATGITISLDTGTTYTATRSNVTMVLDRTNTDIYGDYTPLTYVATLAECRATPGTWTNNSLNVSVWINRSDGAAVTTANTMVLLSGVSNGKTPTSGDIYVSGIDFYGGSTGGFRADLNATGTAAFADCSFKYAGSGSNPQDGFQALQIKVCYLIRCNASVNSNDGFNFTAKSGTLPTGITIDCVGRNNGVSGSTSNNGLTYHDGCKGLDIRGTWDHNYGGNVAITDAGTQLWCIGTNARDSYGDEVFGGTFAPTNWQAIASAEMFLTLCSGSGSERDYSAAAPAVIYYRDYRWHGGSRNGGIAF